MPAAGNVLGIDACKSGWVGIGLDPAGRFAGAWLDAELAGLVSTARAGSPIAVVGIDMPIGLADTGSRAADAAARRLVGRLASSVFGTPVRQALAAETYPEALKIHRELTAGAGFSIQAWGLRTKLLEVDGWVRGGPGVRVHEIHPEVSFATMNNQPLLAGKRTWSGLNVRRNLLRAQGIELPDELGRAGSAGIDDVLDAASVAWSAHRIATGRASCLPAVPQVFSDGIPAAIWF